MTNQATLQGRALARNGAVTLDTNTITRADCATPPPPPTSAPTGPGGGGPGAGGPGAGGPGAGGPGAGGPGAGGLGAEEVDAAERGGLETRAT
jgi:hypothetical protein